MIRNLNQLNFKGYGIIFPERQLSAESPEKPQQHWSLQLTKRDAPIYRTVGETWLDCGAGMTVLSVSLDGETFLDFYLDKPVSVHAGVFFCLSPFKCNAATVEMWGDKKPAYQKRNRKINGFQLSHKLRVTALYTFFYHEKERGFLFPGESHPMLELTYVDQGSLHSVADGQDLVLEQGEMTVYGANQWHMQYADVDVAPRYVTISFDVEGSDLALLANRKLHPTQQVLTLLQQMLREREHMDAYATDMIISMLTQLLLQLLRQSDSADKRQLSNALHAENEIIRRAQQYIGSHIREKLSVPVVAQNVDVSPSYLTALFHKHLQLAPGEYIRRIKLQESKQMIRDNAMNFTEIAAALQYSTVHHFSLQFKEKFGITPTEYARSVR